MATVVNAGVASYQGYLLREYTRLTKISADASTKTAIAADGALKSSEKSFLKTLTEMQKQSAAMEVNAQAAKSSAGIAGETLKQSVVSFKQETRPYVTVETAQLKEKPAAGITLEVITNLHNTGRTPALNLRISHRFDIQTSLPCRYRSDLLTFGADFGIIDIGAGLVRGPLRVDSVRALLKDEADSINAASSFICYSSLIEYNDVFGDPHRTEDCSYYRPGPDLFLYACPEQRKIE